MYFFQMSIMTDELVYVLTKLWCIKIMGDKNIYKSAPTSRDVKLASAGSEQSEETSSSRISRLQL